MKGMIAKDLRILAEGKSLAILGTICGIVCLFTMKDPGFLIGYVTLIATSMGCMSCAYDEMNNGMAYLMTMPCSRTKYVLEKYIFAVVVGLIGWVLSMAVASIYAVNSKEIVLTEMYSGSLVFILLIFIIPGLMIPVVLKFGHARSRIIIYVLIGIMFAAGSLMALNNVASVAVSSDGFNINVFDYHTTIVKSGMILGGIAISVVIYAVSAITSLIIVNKKEY